MAIAPVLLHRDEAERAVLGSILLDATLLEEILLTATDFYLERNQVIFDACRKLAANASPVDIRTLQAKLEHRGEFERIGGLAYLTGLDLDLPDIGRVGAYADIVRERASRRRLQAAERLDRRVRTGQADATTIAAIASREVEELQTRPATSAAVREPPAAAVDRGHACSTVGSETKPGP
jgi:replicative DNA helicase